VDESAVAKAITQAVTELFFSAENQQRFHGAAEDLGVTPPMLKSLIELEPGDGSPMRSLAAKWGCDASFVTVVVDGLEHRGLVERRVADYDRRIKTVELTDEGVAARERALDAVYGPRAGFAALSPTERATLARLLRKMADAQASYDEELLDKPHVRADMRRLAQQRIREFGGGGRGGRRGRARGDMHGWRGQLELHREELLRLSDELDRFRAEVKAQARRPVDEVKAAKNAAKNEVRAEARRPVDEVKPAKNAAKNEVKAQAREARGLKGRGRRR
jgi:DNA-binding MarR family transcriptional regulator